MIDDNASNLYFFNDLENTMTGLTFVIPAYNEEKNIVDTLTRVQAALGRLSIPTEIILVNDGSTDGTLEVARQFHDVRIINHPMNIGYGNSLKTGFRHARYEWVGIVDADGSYHIEEIPAMVAEIERGYDIVIAVRSNLNEIDSIAKRFFRGIFKLLVRFVNDSRIEDPNSGFRIIRRDIVLNLMPFLCGTFSFTTSLTILTSGLYYFIKYIPVRYERRIGFSKVKHFRDSLRTLQYIMQGIIFFNPIKFFLLLAIWNIVFVCFPAMVIAMLRHPVLSLYYMIFGTSLSLMIGMGGLGDILRISSEINNQEAETDSQKKTTNT